MILDEFADIKRVVKDFRWRPEIEIEEVPSPQRISPNALAITAEVVLDKLELGSGRLIVLHDPAGNDAWEGTTRCVAYTRADVEFELVTDPLLTDVGWSWLVDALNDCDANFLTASGTVTTMASRCYGELAEQAERVELEIRASWTPVMDKPNDIENHLAAWQELLAQTTGLAPVSDGVISLVPHLNSGRQR